jgi:preprotein translocase subunit SecE
MKLNQNGVPLTTAELNKDVWKTGQETSGIFLLFITIVILIILWFLIILLDNKSKKE